MGESTTRALIAEDDPELLRTLATALEDDGFDVTLATSGAELMGALGADGEYDLVITDISMPWMTGLQAMHSTRYAGLKTPVIVMTALRDARIPEQVERLGENALFLPKPFTLGELRDAIARLRVHPTRDSRIAT